MYNTLVKTNMTSPLSDLSEALTCMAQPARIQILIALSTHEACVCHLETVLGMSQASISQHLMILRKNRLVVSRRDGRHIYYSPSHPSLIEVFRKVAELQGIKQPPIFETRISPIPDCPCPVCNPELDPKLICKTVPKFIKPN
ncbi:MAG: metalloregulator ArsR/SmtB family transcription factor [Chloroflexi bacterium]|nr:metalloregulator ArsR/SmtB family transcription factor [Chloroflexota bacterium]